MIGCDGCSVWQHVACLDLDPSDLPDLYYCEVCLPRPVNPERAIQIQRRSDTSDSEVNRGILSLCPSIATLEQTQAGLVRVHGPLISRDRGSHQLPVGIPSAEAYTTTQALPQCTLSTPQSLCRPPKVKTVKRIPRTSRDLAARKLATILREVTEKNDIA